MFPHFNLVLIIIMLCVNSSLSSLPSKAFDWDSKSFLDLDNIKIPGNVADPNESFEFKKPKKDSTKFSKLPSKSKQLKYDKNGFVELPMKSDDLPGFGPKYFHKGNEGVVRSWKTKDHKGDDHIWHTKETHHHHHHHHHHANEEDHQHEHGHDHENWHKHEHGHEHGHDHKHENDHNHEHDHNHQHGHKHDHGHEHGHQHDHKNDHEHSHDNLHNHQHEHGHEHNHAHQHQHGHWHDNDHNHDHQHNHEHSHHHKHSGGHKDHGPPPKKKKTGNSLSYKSSLLAKKIKNLRNSEMNNQGSLLPKKANNNFKLEQEKKNDIGSFLKIALGNHNIDLGKLI